LLSENTQKKRGKPAVLPRYEGNLTVSAGLKANPEVTQDAVKLNSTDKLNESVKGKSSPQSQGKKSGLNKLKRGEPARGGTKCPLKTILGFQISASGKRGGQEGKLVHAKQYASGIFDGTPWKGGNQELFRLWKEVSGLSS